MSMAVDILNPQKPKRIAIVASNPSVSKQTGWPIGFWWSELSHPYWGFVECGYQVEIFSPDGGKLEADDRSFQANQPAQAPALIRCAPTGAMPISEFDAVLFVGGQAPMYTYCNNSRVHDLAANVFRTGKVTAVLCHATCLLLKAKLDGKLLVDGKTWTGFANSEEDYADNFVGKRIQPFRIEDEAKKLSGTNFVV